jgi:hypothetical protein
MHPDIHGLQLLTESCNIASDNSFLLIGDGSQARNLSA